MQTGENEQALRKILDMTRMVSLVLLGLHCYYYCYSAFKDWGFTSSISDRILQNIQGTGHFSGINKSKLIALGILCISLLGSRGRKDEKQGFKTAFAYLISGLLAYFISGLIFLLKGSVPTIAMLYIGLTLTGFLLVMTGGGLLSRIIRNRLGGDIFNKENETFPQEERLLENEYSINLPAQYNLKGKLRKSWINVINPFRGLLVLGSPGSGKSYFLIRHVITQHIQKGFSMFLYDFKFPDLSLIVYNTFLKYRHLYKKEAEIYFIDFDKLKHRCNPLWPSSMLDITDAAESSRTTLLSLNRQWIKRQGDFFVESPINFVTAIFWFLRKYQDGEFCTVPHAIELMQTNYDWLFSVLRTEKEIEVLINPFITAYLNDAMEQLEGQIASAKIAMAQLSSPQLYYVLTGNDFTLDINDPEKPKLICMGNNPQKSQIYGAVISLYVSRLIKLVNKPGQLKSSLIFDEFPTIYINNIDNLIATARSNKVATCLGVQDLSQLRKDYGRDPADVIVNIVGNIASGQVAGDTAKLLSDRFGKIMQDRESLTINSQDTSISRSKQLDTAIPPSTISSLSSGHFVGMVADDPDNKIELKTFHAEIINDHSAIKKEVDSYQAIPEVRKLTNDIIQRNYLQIKQDVKDIINTEMERLMTDPALAHLIIKKK